MKVLECGRARRPGRSLYTFAVPKRSKDREVKQLNRMTGFDSRTLQLFSHTQ